MPRPPSTSSPRRHPASARHLTLSEFLSVLLWLLSLLSVSLECALFLALLSLVSARGLRLAPRAPACAPRLLSRSLLVTGDGRR